MLDKKNGSVFHDNLNWYLQYDINTLNLIEKVMMSSENWWLKPSIFYNFPVEKQKIINEDLYCLGQDNILADYDMSIFDELRLSLIKNCSRKRQEKERTKIDKYPEREDFEIRKAEFRKKLHIIC